ncbi:Uncharacterised protein [Mycobacteroides abscessus subsp. abscessus]|nr:Uncharacterised protein [Mycobacteroides abscessus subsp. abscessus]
MSPANSPKFLVSMPRTGDPPSRVISAAVAPSPGIEA